jgi:hypothetical protein
MRLSRFWPAASALLIVALIMTGSFHGVARADSAGPNDAPASDRGARAPYPTVSATAAPRPHLPAASEASPTRSPAVGLSGRKPPGFPVAGVSVAQGPSSDYYIYLPVMFQNFCRGNIFDDFSNPSTGWTVRDDKNVTSGYDAGEFHVLVKAGMYTYWTTPGLSMPSSYKLDVDARLVDTSADPWGMGLVFDMRMSDNDRDYYQFLVDPIMQRYVLFKILHGVWTTLVPWTDAPDAIRPGTAVNHLTVRRVRSQIDLYANGNHLTTVDDGSLAGPGHDAGVDADTSQVYPREFRFDNFRLTVCNP